MSACKVEKCPFPSLAKQQQANNLSDADFTQQYPTVPVSVKIKCLKLPADQSQANAWLRACGFDEALTVEEQKKLKVCTYHFHLDQYNQSTLKNLNELLKRGIFSSLYNN